MNSKNLLEIHELSLRFRTEDGTVDAVKKISFSLREGASLAIVGESGSGKSVTALALTRLLPTPPAEFAGGDILFRGESVLAMTPERLRAIRGGGIAYIFQEPSTSLNPVYPIRSQIAEAIRLHRPEVKDIDKEILFWLNAVGIKNPEKRMHDYPHQFSGGMQQRAMIAMALSCKPSLLVADEPTTALDVTIQAQILAELKRLRGEFGMSLILITHNMAIIRGLCDRLAVMFRGEIVEYGDTASVLANPQHPYTKALMACVPKLGGKEKRLKAIDYDWLADATA
jgi:ABC-type dipeptide/oligopeptide/nickel transport system ATPase component